MSQYTDPHAITTPIRNMRITFWGVRGSCQIFPTPAEVQEYSRRVAVDAVMRVINDLRRNPDADTYARGLLSQLANPADFEKYQSRLGTPHFPIYGGETTCVQIETAEGNTILIDGGSGIRHCAKYLVKSWPAEKPRHLYMFGTHEHLDHRSGLPFSRFCFARPEGFHLHIFGTFGFLNALDERYGVFSRQIRPTTYMDDPIDFRMMSATFHGTEIRNAEDVDPAALSMYPLFWDVKDINKPIEIGSTQITAFNVYHGPTRCLAYKIVHNGATFLFCTDHELRHGADPDDPRQRRSLAAEERLVRYATDVDVAYLDGQYYLDEYLGKKGVGTTSPVPRIDWGHGCIEDIVERVRRCRVKRCLIGHHDPERDWAEQVDMDRWLAELSATLPGTLELAKGDQVIDV